MLSSLSAAVLVIVSVCVIHSLITIYEFNYYFLGSKYAMVQMKTVLSHLLRNFRFESLEDPSQPLRKPQSSLIVIRPRKEVNLIVKQRGQ